MDKPDGDGTAGRTRPPEAEEADLTCGPAPAPSLEPATDLVLQERLTPLLGRVLSAYRRRLWALLLVVALPAVPVVLLGQILEVTPAREGAFINEVLVSTVDPLSPFLLATLGVGVLLGLAVAPICLGGATLLGAADLLGRRISPRQAWRGALRRYFTVAAWLALTLFLVLGALALFLSVLLAVRSPVLSAVLVLGTLLMLFVPWTVSLPLALLEGYGLFRALREALHLARQRFGVHLLFVGVSWVVTVMAGTGLERALIAWTDLEEGVPTLSAIIILVGLFIAPLSLLSGCAPVAYSGGGLFIESHGVIRSEQYNDQDESAITGAGHPRVEPEPTRDLDLARAAEQLPQSPSEPTGRARDSVLAGPRALVVPALVLAVFALPLTGPALLALNPFGLPEMTSHQVSGGTRGMSDEGTLRISPGLLGKSIYGVQLVVCDPVCLTHQVDRTGHGAGLHVEDGGAMWTVWREYQVEEGEDSEAGHPDSGLYLMSCADASDCAESDTEVRVRAFAGRQWDVASSVVPLSDGRLLVASHARFNDRTATLTPDDQGGAYLHLCEDTSCPDPEVVTLPSDSSAGGFLTDGEFLTAVASPTGGYTVALSDAARGSLSVVTCAQDRCEEPTITEIRGDRFYTEHESRLRPRFGARVEYRSDGSPVLAYREPHGGRAHLVDCHDALCSEFTDTAVTGQGWARPVPGLAVDSHDRVHLLTPDFAAERLMLATCLDRSCSRTQELPLLELGEDEPFSTVLALDEQDRPHMLWRGGEVRHSVFGGAHFTGEARYLRCTESYCGAALTP